MFSALTLDGIILLISAVGEGCINIFSFLFEWNGLYQYKSSKNVKVI